MNWMDSLRSAGRVLASAGLAFSLAPASNAFAEAPCRPHYQCPPGYRHMSPGYPYYSAGQYMAPDGSMQPGSKRRRVTNSRAKPSSHRTSKINNRPRTSSSNPATSRLRRTRRDGRACAAGTNTPQLGRLDQANRLNLFDNMAAAPQNRVWFGFQYSNGITTGLAPSSSFISFFTGLSPTDQAVYSDFLSGFTAEQKQINYRVGAEVLVTKDTSIAFQGQYFTNETSGNAFADDWSNPQIMVKHVLARDCDTIVTATLGLTPQTSIDPGDFDENTTKIYPGLLYYETLSPDLFTQGGFQFGIPFREDQITTFDWSVSLGYWLFRDCSLNCDRCCSTGLITGVIPQVNLLGKHTLGSETRANAFGFPSSVTSFDPDGPFDPMTGAAPAPPFTGPISFYAEPETVLDLSVGTLIMIGRDLQLGVGYSFPITDDETRESEFLSYVNYLF